MDVNDNLPVQAYRGRRIILHRYLCYYHYLQKYLTSQLQYESLSFLLQTINLNYPASFHSYFHLLHAILVLVISLVTPHCSSHAGVRRWHWRIHQQLVVSLSEELTSSHWTTVFVSEPQSLWVQSEVSSLTARKLTWAAQQIKSTLWKVLVHFIYT